MKHIITFYILFHALAVQAQTYRIKALVSAPVSSIRGLSVVNDSVIWISGTEGKVGKSTDGGKHWEWFTVPGCDSCDFRDIEAFSGDRAVIMGIAEPARIYLTNDGGRSWKQVYFNDTRGIFLDGMDFLDHQKGVIIGDAIDGIFTILGTNDGGETWQSLKGPAAREGEASFAASGTTIRMLGRKSFAICSGGSASRFFRYDGHSWKVSPIPAAQGAPSRGIFSFAFRNGKQGVAVGGDYLVMDAREGNCLLTNDGGRSWKAPATPPRGYRSAVEYLDGNRVLCTGPTGTDMSADGGLTWAPVSNEGFHAARKAKNGSRVFLAGSKGRIAVLETAE
ncbi:YCF48-related protein [Chitinophaga sp. XS-30]|uniref:WD40/YVTN/BNR-like repeat-containing protein n=1 Tax=Chitinophaga sp. XS-30 TaxID=2604421 RepID=UPI0011DDBFB2|nr:oxidoreductase [Chitinophaga sp. XS-30]QEH42775.1 oxidoreductase [Chitinophaga sp. XS-30]